jgi:CheY-like chemotaxis protein
MARAAEGKPPLDHVLIIEDDYLIAAELEMVLAELGCGSVAYAATEPEAVEAARDKRPSLVMADVRLRVGNGRDAVRTIVRDAPVPAVFVTATESDIDDVDPALIVRKPFTPPDVHRALAAAGFVTSGFGR